jgi:prenyltransferase beta subunit
MWTRRHFLTRGGLGFLGLTGTCFALSDDGGPGGSEALPDGSAAKGMITPETDKAIERGLNYLKNVQHNNGSFGTGPYTGNVAVTSLGAMAFMAAGNQPNRGPHGRLVTDALRYVLSQESVGGGPAGFFHNPEGSPHGPMYGHGFATLFLAEVSGMVHDKKLREDVRGALHRAVALILKSQNRDGGWRYFPHSTDADISVTICQIMALRAARNAGVAVPKSKVDKCVEYVKRCQDKQSGWFKYTIQGGGGFHQAFARTAAGVVALYSAGIYDSPEVKAGLKYLLDCKPTGGAIGNFNPDMHYYYGHYYAVQAMWTAGGDYWTQWFPAIRQELLERQRKDDGSWRDQICQHYATAMACIILQIPNNYLPILQK